MYFYLVGLSFFYFRFVCIRWYRFLSHLCRSFWLRFSRRRWGEASNRFTQTNRRNHYTLWNLIFRFLSGWFLWNRNQSLCPCAYTTTHARTLHNSSFSLIYWLWEWVYAFLLFGSVCLGLGQQIDIFVGCSINVTRVLEFFLKRNYDPYAPTYVIVEWKWSKKEWKYVLKCSHI